MNYLEKELKIFTKNEENILVDSGDTEFIKFKFESLDTTKIEKETGIKFLDYITDYAMVKVINSLKYMRRFENPQFSEKDACLLFEKLVSNGYALEDVVTEIILETAVIGGFLKRDNLEKMKNNMEQTNQEQ